MGKKLAITLRFLLTIYLLLSSCPNHVQAKFAGYVEGGEKTQAEKKKHKAIEIIKIQSLTETEVIIIGEGQIQLIKPKIKIDDQTMKILKELKETEECLKSLVKERETLVGDFWGINITAHRYVNIFDRRNYIRYRIMQVDKKIKKIKLKTRNLRKELSEVKKSSSKKRRNR